MKFKMRMNFKKFILFFIKSLIFSATFAGCATKPAPVEEYVFAKAAIEAAQLIEASRYSPGFYHQAIENFRKGEILYKKGSYAESASFFTKARIAAEKAENSARLTRHKNGEVL